MEDKKYIRSEGNGFTIRVMPSGVKTWLYLYAFDGKRREMNLGSYPDVTLETTTGKFEDAKKKVNNGIDPMASSFLHFPRIGFPRNSELAYPVGLLVMTLRQFGKTALCKISAGKISHKKSVAVIVLSPNLPGHQHNSFIQNCMGCSRVTPSISHRVKQVVIAHFLPFLVSTNSR